jgi:Pectate lyase superfamily protein
MNPRTVIGASIASIAVVFLAAVLGISSVLAATTAVQIFNGGTGTSTTPSYGQLLVGGKNGEYELVASSTLGNQTAASSTLLRDSNTFSGTNAFATTTATLFDQGGAVYNVKAYGAIGNGVHDDTAAIQAAMAVAGPIGGVVFFPPGQYVVSSPLLWQPTFSHSQQTLTAPSLQGSGTGGTPDKGTATSSATVLIASATFPTGNFMIDYIGSSTVDDSVAGFTNGNFTISCNNICAGVRVMNQTNAEWDNIIINNAAAPNPTNDIGSPTAAFNFLASPSSNRSTTEPITYWLTMRVKTAFC